MKNKYDYMWGAIVAIILIWGLVSVISGESSSDYRDDCIPGFHPQDAC